MIQTPAQRDLRRTLSRLDPGPRRAIVELMRDGVPADHAIVMVTGVLSVLQDIGFSEILNGVARAH